MKPDKPPVGPARAPGRPRRPLDATPTPLAPTNQELRELIHQHSLTRADVCRLLDLPVKNYTHSTLQSWLAGSRTMPAMKLTLLRLRLAERAAAKPGASDV